MGSFSLFLSGVIVVSWVLSPPLSKPSPFREAAITALFALLVALNLIRLLPGAITITGNIISTIGVAVGVYSTRILSKQAYSIAVHLVPSGSPLFLIPIMVLIELIRQVVRPLTLGVRLGANLTAGHLLLALVGARILPLELVVAVVQGYVFSLLFQLYFGEFFYGVKSTSYFG